MKVTALIPDTLIEEVKEFAHGKNLTESLIKALTEWTNMQKIKLLNKTIYNTPLKFHKNFSAEHIRHLNRDL